MKRLYLFLIGVSFTFAVMAGNVTPETAVRFAGGFLKAEVTQLELQVPARTNSRDGQISQPAYYVINNPEGGWVIIAADDRISPVIAYSDFGSFQSDDMPENLSYWMDGISRTVEKVRESNLEASERVKAMWASPARTKESGSTQKHLATALWHQEEPYNMYSPVMSGENSPALTGCVATAMAIVCQYNRWPEHGKGVIGGYTTTRVPTYIPPYSIDGHYYDWDNMPASDGRLSESAWTDEQKHQVATLIHDCGVMVKMDYSSDGSGTYGEIVGEAMVSNLSYSESVQMLKRSSYSLTEWFEIMKNEIDNGRPVLYGGIGSEGGHEFVCDGYDTDGSKLGINWGWGGKGNGYYSLDLPLSDSYGFTDKQDAIIGIAPDTVHAEMPQKETLNMIYSVNCFGLIPNGGHLGVKAGSEVNFKVGYFLNTSRSPRTFSLRVCLVDANGNIRQTIGGGSKFEIPAINAGYYSYYIIKGVLTVDVALTDTYVLQISFQPDQWRNVTPDLDMLPNEETVRCGVVSEPFIMMDPDCQAGDEVTLKLTDGYVAVKDVTWTVNDVELDGPSFTIGSGKTEIKADILFVDGTEGVVCKTVIL